MLFMIIFGVLNILINLLIIYYLHQLKNNKECNDYDYSNDWRHNALYVLAIYNIIVGLSLLLFPFLLASIPSLKKYVFMLPDSVIYLFELMHGFVGIIFIYSFFSYVGMHNKNKLGCLTSESPLNTVHKFLNIWRYVLLFLFILSLLLQFIFLSLGNTNNDNLKLNKSKK